MTVGFSTSLSDGQELMTLEGSKLTIHIKEGMYYVNGAKVVMGNIITSNGVVHVIDGYVLFYISLSLSVDVPVILTSTLSVF